MVSALGISLGFTAFTAIAFSLLRPYNQAIYAPKLKHADEKHAPPPIGKAPWSWVSAIWSAKEEHLIQVIGMDAVVFLRFCRMCRNMFLTLTITGIGILVPVHVTGQTDVGQGQDKNPEMWVTLATPEFIWGQPIWAQVVVAWLFNIIVGGYLWWNYRKILYLRRKYFEGEEYQNSLHSRTLMVGSNCSGVCDSADRLCSSTIYPKRVVLTKELQELSTRLHLFPLSPEPRSPET